MQPKINFLAFCTIELAIGLHPNQIYIFLVLLSALIMRMTVLVILVLTDIALFYVLNN